MVLYHISQGISIVIGQFQWVCILSCNWNKAITMIVTLKLLPCCTHRSQAFLFFALNIFNAYAIIIIKFCTYHDQKMRLWYKNKNAHYCINFKWTSTSHFQEKFLFDEDDFSTATIILFYIFFQSNQRISTFTVPNHQAFVKTVMFGFC